MASPNEHRLWYVRRNRDVRGPFPTAVISQFLLLGRLGKNDEVSIDQQEWQRIANVEELQPEVMKADLTERANQANLEATRHGADERAEGDRRPANDPDHADQRKGERRAVETEEMLAHRQQRAAMRQAQRETENKRQFLILTIVLVLLFFAVGAVVFTYQPSQDKAAMDCSADPAPGVNWSNCNFQGSSFDGVDLSRALIRNANLSNVSLYRTTLTGVDLAYANLGLANLRMSDLNKAMLTGASLRGADLRGADLRGADLSYADLQGAQLAGASLDGARLDKTIWIDGELCAQGSVGGCLPAKAE